MGLYAGDVGQQRQGKGGLAPVLILGAVIAVGAVLEVVMKSSQPTTNGFTPPLAVGATGGSGSSRKHLTKAGAVVSSAQYVTLMGSESGIFDPLSLGSYDAFWRPDLSGATLRGPSVPIWCESTGASGTVVEIAGYSLTAGTDFSVAGSDTDMAQALADAINAKAGLSDLVTADRPWSDRVCRVTLKTNGPTDTLPFTSTNAAKMQAIYSQSLVGTNADCYAVPSVSQIDDESGNGNDLTESDSRKQLGYFHNGGAPYLMQSGPYTTSFPAKLASASNGLMQNEDWSILMIADVADFATNAVLQHADNGSGFNVGFYGGSSQMNFRFGADLAGTTGSGWQAYLGTFDDDGGPSTGRGELYEDDFDGSPVSSSNLNENLPGTGYCVFQSGNNGNVVVAGNMRWRGGFFRRALFTSEELAQLEAWAAQYTT